MYGDNNIEGHAPPISYLTYVCQLSRFHLLCSFWEASFKTQIAFGKDFCLCLCELILKWLLEVLLEGKGMETALIRLQRRGERPWKLHTEWNVEVKIKLDASRALLPLASMSLFMVLPL